jgi:Flp pilus assembly protein TadG
MHVMAKVNVRRRLGESGQAIIEMALTLPLLLLIVLGMFDFGLMFQRYEVVTNAAREGARIGVLQSAGYSTANAEQRALDYLAVGGLSGATRGCGAAYAAGSRCAGAVISTTTITGSSPAKTVNQVTVTVEYDHAHVFVGPIISLFGGSLGTTRLRSVSTMRVE